MPKQTNWVWAGVVCAGLVGAGGVVVLAQPDVKPAGAPPGVPPAPAAKPKPPADEWVSKRDKDGKIVWDVKTSSAFPNLVLPEGNRNDPDLLAKREAAFEQMCPRLTGKTAVQIAPADDVLRKLLKARLDRGYSNWSGIGPQ